MTILLRELYTAPELAGLVGISRFRMRRMLLDAGVANLRSGRTTYFTRRSIIERLPDLWDSVLDGAERGVEEHARTMARTRARARTRTGSR